MDDRAACRDHPPPGSGPVMSDAARTASRTPLLRTLPTVYPERHCKGEKCAEEQRHATNEEPWGPRKAAADAQVVAHLPIDTKPASDEQAPPNA
jgi:hypothetical protein